MAEINLSKGMLVELVPGAETVYPRALAGMRGIVRGLKDDDGYGFPQAFIEWDKQHWRYNGEKDGWTYASHFRPVEGDGESEVEIVGAEVYEIPSTPPRIPTEEEDEQMESYINTIGFGFERASESQGFFLITFKRTEEGALKLEMLGAATDPDLAELPQSHILKFAEMEMRRLETEAEEGRDQ